MLCASTEIRAWILAYVQRRTSQTGVREAPCRHKISDVRRLKNREYHQSPQ